MSSASVTHSDLANAIRALAMDAVEAAQSGHPGMPMGTADMATVLFGQVLKYDPAHPDWPDRDRFVLSAGHGSMLLYALLHLTGYPGMEIEDLRRFRQLGSKTAGHPEYGHAAGIEVTTGPLGQGIATAVGLAMAEARLAGEFGADLVDHRTWVIAGDGCLMEGISHEAIDLAGHLKLNKLCVLFDDNGITIDGATGLSTSTDQLARFAAAGWNTEAVDGHDPVELLTSMLRARESDRPTLIACRTTIGYGAPTKGGSAATHGSPLGAGEIAGAREKLGWPHDPFVIPAPILDHWRLLGARGGADFTAWTRRLDANPRGPLLEKRLRRELSDGWVAALDGVKAKFLDTRPKTATRQASGMVLDALDGALPELFGGSADLTGSNNTKAKAAPIFSAGNRGGRYVHWGIREHGMAAAMNGIALHGGLIPFGGTFLVFSDYSRPAIRLAALMDIPVIHVLTHDSIGLGEDGPTHQPVEHLAALRAIPNLAVFRPADAVETAECWALALARSGPSALALTRQGLATLPHDGLPGNRCATGAYVVQEAAGPRRATLIGTGSEVGVALLAQAILGQAGIDVAVVSMPCWELLEAQPAGVQDAILGPRATRFAIEAAIGFGWERWLPDATHFIGMQGFGASAPAEDLYRHFGITAEALAARVQEKLG